VDSEAYLFADDTKIFRIITGENDHDILQEDLQKMEDWNNNCLLNSMVVFFVQNFFFSDNTRVRIFFFVGQSVNFFSRI
jgi:hypothetical protein